MQLSFWKTAPLLLYGVLFFLLGFATCLIGTAFLLVSGILPHTAGFALGVKIVCCSGFCLWFGMALGSVDLFVLLRYKRAERRVGLNYPQVWDLTVVLTAYNDELSIGPAVADFRGHPRVRRVIVVDNNSIDATKKNAVEAGATVVFEARQGYGYCVYRALQEASAFEDTELTLLCEGDMTFRAYDIDKFLAYLPHADIVNGTRIVEQLRSRDTQLTTFMYYGNFFVGKLLEVKYIGKGTFTDVGTTYKLCRNSALRTLLPALDPRVNLEFNAHFLDRALASGLRLVECPVTFHDRVGVSKGGNSSNWRAVRVGLRMMAGIIFGWRSIAG
jgi:glycosyltransferase involved in cell wall biosynthesis